MKLVWKLLRRHLSAAQFAGFFLANLVGVAIVLTALQLYRDVMPVYSMPDSFMSNDYLILSKRVGSLQALGIGNSDFTRAELEELSSQSFSGQLGEFSPALYRVTGSIEIGEMTVSTYLFFESVPDQFIDVKSERWDFDEGDEVIPIIIPKNYLNLYNFGFAQSQGLPQVSQDIFGMVTLDIRISGNGRAGYYKGKIVGFSNRLNTILVPQKFIEWSNDHYGNGRGSGVSRVILEVDNPSDKTLHTFLDQKGYEIEGDNQDAGKSAYFLRILTSVVIGIGLIITALSFFVLMLSVFLLLQKNAAKLENLLLLGYTPAQVSRPYQLLTGGLNLLVLLVGMVMVIIVRKYYLGLMGSLWEGYEPSGVWMTFMCGLGLAVVVTAANCLAIRRKVASLWLRK